MNRWLLWKEGREVAGIAAIGFAACLLMAGFLMNLRFIYNILGSSGDNRLPFVQPFWLYMYWMIVAAMAVLLGLKQSLWEDYQGTYRFLLHRPISRHRLIAHKLAVGLGLQLIVAGIPLIILALWAATPGTHTGPFEWSMVVPSVQCWLASSLFYLGGFLCGMRPARWVGTRIAPFGGAFVIYFAISLLSSFWVTWIVCWLIASALVIAAILLAGDRRDFA